MGRDEDGDDGMRGTGKGPCGEHGVPREAERPHRVGRCGSASADKMDRADRADRADRDQSLVHAAHCIALLQPCQCQA